MYFHVLVYLLLSQFVPRHPVLTLERKDASRITAIAPRDELHENARTQRKLYTIGGRVYMTSISLARKPYTLVLDTGSSDTWIASSDFRCLSRHTDMELKQSACGFGALYDQNESLSWEKIETHDFEVKYMDGEFLNGEIGTEDFEIGGLELRQTIGVVERGWWIGDRISSGLIGLAYPILASGHRDLNYTRFGIFAGQSLRFENYTLPPVFSLALSRPDSTGSLSGGLLALGGLPAIPHSPTFVTVPIHPVQASAYAFYSIPVDGFDIIPSKGFNLEKSRLHRRGIVDYTNRTTTTIIDSGTTLMYLPDDVADSIASFFSPPATYDSLGNLYRARCSAQIPQVGVNIGGETFWVDDKDLLAGGGSDREGSCLLSVQRQGYGDAVLGDAFLKNVVAVFDLGVSYEGEKVIFIQHSDNESALEKLILGI
ncbi:acid protease [Lojkania enalia]|uniref:Acid protease n=1 Tax=Lojkania enalia TaxID=147567 RepID=A0A9P4NAU4_9PLEO|nr:acid protease [Didymosphaeria enalia]